MTTSKFVRLVLAALFAAGLAAAGRPPGPARAAQTEPAPAPRADFPPRAPTGLPSYRLKLARAGDLHLTALTGEDRVRPDRAIAVSVETYHAEKISPALRMIGTVRRVGTPGSIRPLALTRIDSTHTDWGHLVHDLRFVGEFVPDAEGEYEVLVRAAPPLEDVIAGGPLRGTIRAIAVHATLTGTYTREDRDTDGDSLTDDVVIRPEVDVAEPGSFSIRAELCANGRTEWAVARLDLSRGVGKSELHFLGKHLRTREFGTDSLALQVAIRDGMAYTMFDQRVLDSAFRLPARLERGDIEFIGEPTVDRIDRDHNGRIDELVLRFEVELRRPGRYHWKAAFWNATQQLWATVATREDDVARAPDSAKVEVMLDSEISGRADSTLSDGRHALALRFDGRRLSLLAPGLYEIRDLEFFSDPKYGVDSRDNLRELLHDGLALGTLGPAQFERASSR